MSTEPLVNEQLLEHEEYFASPGRREEMRGMFGFERRRLLLGEGAASRLPEECRRFGAGSVMIVHDAALEAVAAPVVEGLREAGLRIAATFTGIVPNPRVASVDALAAAVAGSGAEAVVAIGGGSTMDTAKVGLCVAANGGSTADYFGFDLFERGPLQPLVCLPTTAGTGAEASCVSVVVAEVGKQAVYSEHLHPAAAIVDPRLSAGMPPGLTATTGLDALGHALECTASKKSGPLGDAVARASLAAGMPHLRRAIENGADAEARLQMCRCSLLAGLLLSPINTGAAHALGYGIEKLSHEKGRPVPHGTAVALVLPGVMDHNAPAAADKYYYAAGAAGLDLAGKSREEGARRAAGWIDDVRRRHTPFATLADAGLGEADLPRMIEVALQVRRLLDPNPVEVTADDAERIYRGVLA